MSNFLLAPTLNQHEAHLQVYEGLCKAPMTLRQIAVGFFEGDCIKAKLVIDGLDAHDLLLEQSGVGGERRWAAKDKPYAS